MKINIIQQLLETRSHSHLNVKKHPIEVLKQYKSNGNVFVSFAKYNKVGINPSSLHDTPIGFYCYPIQYILKNYEKTQSLLKSRPYPNLKTNYILVVEVKSWDNVYDVEDLTPPKILKKIKYMPFFKGVDLHKIVTIRGLWHEIYKRFNMSDLYFDDMEFDTDIDDDYDDDEIQEKQINTYKPINVRALSIFRELGIDGITDIMGSKTIHHNEPVQAVFFNTRILNHLETLLDKQ